MAVKKVEEKQSPIERAMSIERLVPVQDGVYVCTNAKTKKYEVVPLEQVKVVVNGMWNGSYPNTPKNLDMEP